MNKESLYKKSNKRIRVMALAYSMYDGGAERVILNNLSDFHNDREIEYKLFVYSFEGKSNIMEEIKAKQLNVEYLTDSRSFHEQERLSESEREKIEQSIWDNAIRNFKPDIVHVHISSLLKNTIDPISKNNVPIRLVTLHSDPSRASGIILEVIRRAFSEYNFIPICLNKYQQEKAKNIYLFERSIIVHNGIDYTNLSKKIMSKDAARNAIDLPEDHFIVAGVGRVAPVKNYPLMIDIFSEIHKKNKKSILVIAGSCRKKDRILLSLRALSRHVFFSIRFLGNVSNVVPIYCASDVLLMTSYTEASPLSLLEAQYCGTKCVVSPGVPTESIVTELVTKVSGANNMTEWIKAVENNNSTEPVFSFDDYDARKQSVVIGDIYKELFRGDQ